jgi:hypothetical protein
MRHLAVQKVGFVATQAYRGVANQMETLRQLPEGDGAGIAAFDKDAGLKK